MCGPLMALRLHLPLCHLRLIAPQSIRAKIDTLLGQLADLEDERERTQEAIKQVRGARGACTSTRKRNPPSPSPSHCPATYPLTHPGASAPGGRCGLLGGGATFARRGGGCELGHCEPGGCVGLHAGWGGGGGGPGGPRRPTGRGPSNPSDEIYVRRGCVLSVWAPAWVRGRTSDCGGPAVAVAAAAAEAVAAAAAEAVAAAAAEAVAAAVAVAEAEAGNVYPLVGVLAIMRLTFAMVACSRVPRRPSWLRRA
jgi:hypothetical protein